MMASIYVALAFACCGWVAYTFGVGCSFFLGFILAVPVFIYLRISWRQVPQGREVAYLAGMTLAVLAATTFLIWKWYDAGMVDLAAFRRGVAEFQEIVRSQPRFTNIEIDYTLRKGGRNQVGRCSTRVAENNFATRTVGGHRESWVYAS